MMKPYSVHVFAYYQNEGAWLLKRLKEFYNGHIYLSLINNSPTNKELLSIASSLFDITVTYVENMGTDQFGFYESFKKDNIDSDWVLYLHDKNINKQDWLEELIHPLSNINLSMLNRSENIGIIASAKHKNKVKNINQLVAFYGNIDFKYRKLLVLNMHTVIWIKELQRILLEKYNLSHEDSLCPEFTAGNVFLARKDVIQQAHQCIYKEFFDPFYQPDGKVEHALERFYFYVSQCLGYQNLYI